MSGMEVGTAYVRVRPQMSSFRAETQTGIRSAFSTVGKILLPTIAFAGITEGVRKSVAEAELKQVVTGQLQQAFRQVGLSFSQNAPQVEAGIKQQEHLGFAFDESAQAMTRSVRATKSVTVAQKLQAAAADLARGQNIGLLQATQILIRAYNGQSAGLKRLGVDVAKHAKGVAVLDAVQQKFAGSAKKFSESAAGAQQRLSASLKETEAIVGSALLPTVTRLNTRLADWLDNTEHQKKLQDAVNNTVRVGGRIIHDFTSAVETVGGPLKTVVDLLGGFANVAEKALVIGLIVKARSAALGLAGLASGGQASAGLLDKAFITVGQKLGGVALTSDEVARKIVADARAEALAFKTVGIAATGIAGKSAAAGFGGPIGGRLQAVTSAATAGALLEANRLEGTLNDVTQATENFAQSSMLETAQNTAKQLGQVGVAQNAISGVIKTTSAEEAASFAKVGASASVAANDVAMIGNAAELSAVKVGGLQALLGRVLIRAGGGQAAAGSAAEGALLTGVGLKGLLRGSAALLGRATGIGLTAYIANSLIQSFTGKDVAGTVLRAFANQFKGPESPDAILADSARKMGKAMRSIPALVLARDEAQLAAQTARLTLSQDKSAHSTIEWRQKNEAFRISVADLEQKERDLERAQNKARDAANRSAEAINALGFKTRDSASLAALFGEKAAQAGVSTSQWTSKIQAAAAANEHLSPLQRHNIDLLIQFTQQIHRIPTLTEIKVILNNRSAKASLTELLAFIKKSIFTFESEGGATVDFSARTARATAEAPQRHVPGGLFHPFTAAQQREAAITATEGQTGAARISALKAQIDADNKAVDADLGIAHRALGKRRQKFLDAAQTAKGEAVSLQSQIDQINQDAATKAKTARDAAKAAARAAAAKEHKDHLEAVATQIAAVSKTADAAKKLFDQAAAKGLGAKVIAARKAAFEVAEKALISIYKREQKDTKLLGSERRRFAKLAISTAAAEVTDEKQAQQTLQQQRENSLKLAVQSADLAVSRAGGDQTKLDAALKKERAALQRLIDFDKKKANDLSITKVKRQQYQAEELANMKKLTELGKNKSGGFTLSQLFAEAASEFATYGSNIAAGGAPLSPQDERAALGKAITKLAKRKAPPVVVQHFYAGSANQQQAFTQAKTAAEHLYIGA